MASGSVKGLWDSGQRMGTSFCNECCNLNPGQGRSLLLDVLRILWLQAAAQNEPGPAKDEILSVGFLLCSSCSLSVKPHDSSYMGAGGGGSEDRYVSQVIKRDRDEPVPHRDFIHDPV